MYSDPISDRGPIRDRLGSNPFNQRTLLQRQPPDRANRNGALYADKNYIRKAVPENLTSKLGKELQISSRSNSFSAREGPRMSAKNYQTPKNASCVESKDKGTTQVRSGKESAAVSSGENKRIMRLTVETFLEKLGLSKYLATFKAEEIDMYAMRHMNEDDLKAIGLPMGPRKKILHSLSRLKPKK
ncbi:uncharacterized protein LOC109846387 isoform X2 [Asparagus officinalis]|uniref:uncharacterized protein LOC109846387 isoform X2 n=1 Tax=Asparagus officinalis TaxID=4686 RepID=UPI00098E7D22|nr:uncharacterized protein LOC109846387 isoform X2 [Asparagus officinalis]